MQAGDKESFVMFPSVRSAGGRSKWANPTRPMTLRPRLRGQPEVIAAYLVRRCGAGV
jgi:hypothetical protein